MTRAVLLAVVTLITASPFAAADNWPSWRGPTYNGVAPGSGFPTEWSQSKNVLWKIELQGIGASTPAVWDDAIFLTTGVDGQNTVICYDQKGQERWRKGLGEEVAGKNPKASGSNPSPTTDGKHVYVYFKSGDLACLDFAGNIKWQHNLQEMYGEDTLWWDLGTSPVLLNDLVIVACIHSGPSYLVAFNKTTGEVEWKHDRNCEAPNESQQTYSTPIPTQINGRDALVVLGADHVTAHDAKDGSEIWRLGGLNPKGEGFFRSIASPVIDNGIVIVPYARGESLTAVSLDSQGDASKSVLWSITGISADVPTPAAQDQRIYVCGDLGQVACLNANDGKVIWKGEVERRGSNKYSSSPIIADGKLYVTYENGTTTVLELGDEFKPIAVNKLNDFIVATPVFINGKILIRTDHNLYCIGK